MTMLAELAKRKERLKVLTDNFADFVQDALDDGIGEGMEDDHAFLVAAMETFIMMEQDKIAEKDEVEGGE